MDFLTRTGNALLTSCPGIPDAHGVIPAAADQASPICTEGDTGHGAGVARQRKHRDTGLEIPKLDRKVRTGCGHPLIVYTTAQVKDITLMAGQLLKFLTGCGIPERDETRFTKAGPAARS